MLDNKGFDLWADSYNTSVELCEENEEYPFAGYKEVLNMIYSEVRERKSARVLDIGFGTGVLTTKLYQDGYDITGIDFSHKMVEISALKMPKAQLIQWDFSKGLPDVLLQQHFDYIISTYAIHHLTNQSKIDFLNLLGSHLNTDGKILIGDVSFKTTELLEKCKERYQTVWDDDEIYFTYREIEEKLNFPVKRYTALSHCAGVLLLKK